MPVMKDYFIIYGDRRPEVCVRSCLSKCICNCQQDINVRCKWMLFYTKHKLIEDLLGYILQTALIKVHKEIHYNTQYINLCYIWNCVATNQSNTKQWLTSNAYSLSMFSNFWSLPNKWLWVCHHYMDQCHFVHYLIKIIHYVYYKFVTQLHHSLPCLHQMFFLCLSLTMLFCCQIVVIFNSVL